MQLHGLKLVTVVAEALLRDKICEEGLQLGATGYTVVEAIGSGARGVRRDSIDGENVQIQFVCPVPVADKILTHVSHTYFENYAVIAWVTDVWVVRGRHYDK